MTVPTLDLPLFLEPSEAQILLAPVLLVKTLPFFLEPSETEIFLAPAVLVKFLPLFLDPVCTGNSGGGGSGGSCEDPRPDTGMLYPRG